MSKTNEIELIENPALLIMNLNNYIKLEAKLTGDILEFERKFNNEYFN